MARKIQEEWEGEEERNRIAKEKAANEALIRNFDDIKARIEVDRLLAEKLQEQEREQFSIEERAKFLPETIASQRKFLAQQRSEAIRNRPPTKNQLRNQMMTYLKHIKRSDEDFISIGSAKDERLIKKMNEKGVDSSKSEVLKEESKEEVQKESKEEESTRKRKLGTRKKMKSRKRRYIQNTSEDDSEKENDELRLHLTIAPDEEKEVDYEILDRKYPIKEWKTKCLGTKPQIDQAKDLEEINHNVVIRSNGQKRYFSTLMRVLSIFDREDLNAVYQLVMDRFQDEIPEDWIIVSWKLHSSSGVHTLVTETGIVIHMLVEKKYPLRKEVLMQMLKLKLESEEDSTMALELIRCCCVAEKTKLLLKKDRVLKDQEMIEDHLVKFHKITDAKEMWDAIKSRFGGNNESKNMQKYILKQQFEGFSISNTEGLHKGYDMPSTGTTHVAGVESSSSQQNVAFVSKNTSSTNDVSTAYYVPNPSGQNSKYEQTSSYSLLANQSSFPQLDHYRLGTD
ncbi:hypothetical protein Tco_1094269 [Tanacetum coccineum]|uniref:Uncharacterized protein n=1 Tax=Tanacetum coccineum TaxID=301880 RepID=A0ABQ5IF16_9ASTR